MDIVKRLKKGTGEDFISELPDSILVHILSFLPTRDAINTVLLRRFGNLWRSVPVIDLNGCLYHECLKDLDDFDSKYYFVESRKFYGIIRRVSHLHDVRALDKLNLKFHFPINYLNNESHTRSVDDAAKLEWEKAAASHIDKLVAYAINRKVKILNLNFRGCILLRDWELHPLPDLLRSNYLADMRLTCCNINSCEGINLKALRVLFLDEVSLSDKIMENILLGSPVLEDLSLVKCYGLGKLYCENPNLKRLMLTFDLFRNEERLHVMCPHVTSLEIVDWTCAETLVDVSSLVEVSISYTCIFSLLGEENVVCAQRLLQMISLCRTLIVCRHTILMLAKWNFRNVPCASYHWKNLIVKLDPFTKWHHPGLSWLLRSCRSLETLTIHIYPDDHWLLPCVSEQFSHDFEPKGYWDHCQEARFPRLECITVNGYVNEPHVDQMLKFLLKNTTNLQKMVISIKEFFETETCDAAQQEVKCSSCQVLKIVRKLSASPRASSQAMVYLSC